MIAGGGVRIDGEQIAHDVLTLPREQVIGRSYRWGSGGSSGSWSAPEPQVARHLGRVYIHSEPITEWCCLHSSVVVA
jgi:hypothetical protein